MCRIFAFLKPYIVVRVYLVAQVVQVVRVAWVVLVIKFVNACKTINGFILHQQKSLSKICIFNCVLKITIHCYLLSEQGRTKYISLSLKSNIKSL